MMEPRMGRRVWKPDIRVKRAYEAAAPEDGERYLVDRLWPRGVKRDALRLKAWLKVIAPSAELRLWFGHDPSLWEEFRRRYGAELAAREEELRPILDAARRGTVTLLYGAKDKVHNNAVVLRNHLEKMLAQTSARVGRRE
ncbi:MAG: DUF488 family protein [Elusimicrobia bacterium]|nr:DUF488 family protein [Elusimicrobiota bacterium]